jgi:hypothetical protein
VHPPLGEARLGARLLKIVGPQATPAMRELAARALVPLIGAETWLALYHLWALGDEPHASLAGRTAAELPGPPIFAALADPLVPPPALDFMARRRLARPDELAVLVRHPMVADATLGLVARCAPARVCEAIAAVHRRLLACPTIAAALACNPHCPPSALHAAVELGARERVPGMRGLHRALLAGHVRPDSPDDHAARTDAAARSRPGEQFSAPSLPPDPDDDPDLDEPAPVHVHTGGPPATPPRPGVDLVLDPRTPLPLAMSLLSRLRAPDLRRVVQARRLPPVLVAAARRRLGA